MMNERNARRKVNELLHQLGLTYHESIPLHAIDQALTTYGFNCTEGAIYCGRDGNSLEQVGPKTWLSLSWHKMDVSGHYEVVAYVS